MKELSSNRHNHAKERKLLAILDANNHLKRLKRLVRETENPYIKERYTKGKLEAERDLLEREIDYNNFLKGCKVID